MVDPPSLRFRLRYSSYRGIRFRFAGRPAELYLIAAPLLLVVLPGALTAAYANNSAAPPIWVTAVIGTTFLAYGAFVPYLHYRFKRYQHGSSFYGSTPARFTATAGAFYAVYAIVLLIITWGLVGDGSAAHQLLRSVERSVRGLAAGLIIFTCSICDGVGFVWLLQNRIWTTSWAS